MVEHNGPLSQDQEKNSVTSQSVHHSFNVEYAQRYGIPEAILIHHFQYWVSFNRRLKKNIRDEKCWTCQSRVEIQAHFPYMDSDTIRRTCERLVEKGVLITANYNKSKINKTLWYAFKDEAAFGVADFQINFTKGTDASSKGTGASSKGTDASSIKDNKQDNKERYRECVGAPPPVATAPPPLPSKKKKTSSDKKKFLDHVWLKESEHQKLIERFGQYGADKRIEKLNAYIGSKNKHYASHYHTVISWDLSDLNKEKTTRIGSEEENDLLAAHSRYLQWLNQVSDPVILDAGEIIIEKNRILHKKTNKFYKKSIDNFKLVLKECGKLNNHQIKRFFDVRG